MRKITCEVFLSTASGDRLRDLPEWLEEFTDNLEDIEVSALANTSQDSDSERHTKVHPGSKVFVQTFLKTEIAKSASEPRVQGLLAGSGMVKQYLVQKNLVT